MGETGLWSPRGSHAKEPHALDLCSNQINLQRFDFKRRLLCGPNTTGRLGPRRGQDVRLEARKAHSTIQAEWKTKGDQDTMNNRIYFPASFLAWAPLSTRNGVATAEATKPEQSLPSSAAQKELFLPSPHYFLFVCLV